MAPLQQPLAAAFDFVRYQHGDQIDGCHGIGLSLQQTCFQHVRPCRSCAAAAGRDQVRSDSWIGFLEVDALLDQVAILGQFTDERIDLAQRQRRLRAALQIAAHEAILGSHPVPARRRRPDRQPNNHTS